MQTDWLRNITRDKSERGVSPVIATILVVAIVVIISASLAAVTFGFTDNLSDPAPTTAFEYDYNNGWNITHTNGDSIDPSKLQVRVDDPDGDATGVYEWPGSDVVSAGTTVDLGKDTNGNEEVSIIWSDGDRSASISSSSTPGSSSGSSSGGGGGPTLAASFGVDEQPAGNNNPINIKLTDENGDPISSASVTVEIVGDANIVAGSSGLVITPNNYGEQETFTTESNGEVADLVLQSDALAASGDVVEVEIRGPSGLSETITYEIA